MAAGLVDQHRRGALLGEVAVTPTHERHEDGGQFDPHRCEPVLVAGRVLLVADLLEDPVLDEALESIGQHGACNPEIGAELVVAADTPERVADDQDRPAVADDLQRTGDGARRLLIGVPR